MQHSSDSQFLLAHAQTPWNNIYQQEDDVFNTIQMGNAETLHLRATKGFHDLVGSVGISADRKFVIVIQGDFADVFRSAVAQIVTRYIAAMEDYSPYPESGQESVDEAGEFYSGTA